VTVAVSKTMIGYSQDDHGRPAGIVALGRRVLIVERDRRVDEPRGRRVESVAG